MTRRPTTPPLGRPRRSLLMIAIVVLAALAIAVAIIPGALAPPRPLSCPYGGVILNVVSVGGSWLVPTTDVRRLGSDYRACEACSDARIALAGAQMTSQFLGGAIQFGLPQNQVALSTMLRNGLPAAKRRQLSSRMSRRRSSR